MSEIDLRAMLQAAVAARLERVTVQRDLAAVLVEEATQEALKLTELLTNDEADPQSRFLLGWLYWFRFQALPEGQDLPELESAISMLTPCMLGGIELQQLPEPLLPVLASQAIPAATELLEQALSSADPELISAAVNIWTRLLSATPDEDANRAARLSNLRLALQALFERMGTPADLEEAIRVGREAVTATPTGHSDRADMLARLGLSLQTRFERTGEVANLEEAIAAYREAVTATRGAHPERAAMLSNLGQALLARFEQMGVLADLEDAIRMGREAVAAVPSGHADRAAMLEGLGLILQTRFERTGTVADHEEAIAAYREAVTTAPGSHPRRAASLLRLGNALTARFGRAGAMADLDEAVAVYREAVAAAPSGHADRVAMLAGLGLALQTRFEHTGTVADIDEVIAAYREAVTATPVGHPNRAVLLAGLGNALQVRFERTGALADIDEAVARHREALAVSRDRPPDRAGWLSNLGNALRTRFEQTSTRTDLEEAIRAGREAVEATPRDHHDRAAILANFRKTLQARFEQTGAPADLEEALRIGREAVEATPRGHHDRATRLSSLGDTLHSKFERTGVLADLEEAIAAYREAVAAASSDHPDRAGLLSDLGNALQDRFMQTGASGDLREAVARHREAVAVAPNGHPYRAAILSNLGGALQIHFGQTGALADLDEAIAIHREAVAATPVHHYDRGNRLANLGGSLRMRFGHTGALADLEQAIRIVREAVAATPSSHPDRPGKLHSLATVLQARFERTGAPADLDEAITNHREAVAATPIGYRYRANMLSNLGSVLRARFERTGAPADLDEAIANHREAVEATPGGHAERGGWLSNLGNSLQARFELTGSPTDLEEAIRVGREAVRVTSSGHSDCAARLLNLGLALRSRFRQTGDQADLDAAIDVLSDAVGAEAGPPSLRIRAARAGSELSAASRPERAANLMERAVRLLPEVAPRELERSDQQYALGGLSGLAGDAAALVLAASSTSPAQRATLALQLLETGRAILLGQALQVRNDLTSLTEQHPGLAARFKRLRELLDRGDDPAVTSVHPGSYDRHAPATDDDRIVLDRRRLAGELAGVITEIRAKHGFGSFARPPSMDDLIQHAAAGPVVAFNVSRYRSDALLLTDEGITSVPLPGLAIETVITQVNAFHQALYSATHSMRFPERTAAQRQLSEILEWLWDNAAGPVLDTLGYRTQPTPGARWPRLWWAPGGLIGLLPMHAAGYHNDPAEAPGKRTVLDRVISSYTPTITALHYARRPSAPHQDQGTAPSALIVAMPTTPGLPDNGLLRFVHEEARKLAGRLPGAITLIEPDPDGDAPSSAVFNPDTAPTLINVFAHLAACPVAHFACHGTHDPADPSNSRLLLHDHRDTPLTVSALASLHLGNVRLAYLSACDTALSTSTQLIDEAIHLASAFQLAGYPHVIGTLWAIDDDAAVQIADAFYASLTMGRGNAIDASYAAAALHDAVRTIRASFPTAPSLWASHIHAGA